MDLSGYSFLNNTPVQLGTNTTDPNKLAIAGTTTSALSSPLPGVNVNLGSTLGLQSPVPINQAPVPTSTPSSPTPTNNNQGLIDKYKASGWNDMAAILGDIAAGGGSKFNTSSVNYDDIYNPALGVLNDQSNILRNQEYPSQLSDLEAATAKQKADLQAGIKKSYESLDDQSTQNDKNKESALNEAVRYYNALQQRSRAQWGTGSSPGQALSDIGNQEFQRNQARITESWQSSSNSLIKYRRDVADFALKKDQEIDSEKTRQQTQLKIALDKALNEIASQRAGIEGQKASQKVNDRLALIQQATSFAQSIQAQALQAKQQLILYKAQEDGKIQEALTALTNNVPTVQQILYNQQPNTYNTNTTKPVTNLTRKVEDPLDQLLNPFS
jgi:hypothetical protein